MYLPGYNPQSFPQSDTWKLLKTQTLYLISLYLAVPWQHKDAMKRKRGLIWPLDTELLEMRGLSKEKNEMKGCFPPGAY